MTKNAIDKLHEEIKFQNAQKIKNHDLCPLHLGRAHIISQQSAFAHLKLMKNGPQLTQTEGFQLWCVPGHLDKKVVQSVVSALGKHLS